MTNDTSDTKFSEFTEQSAEPLTVAEPSVQTLISPAHDNNTNTLQSEENLQIETSSPRTHGNNEELSHDLHTVRNFIHKIITLSQEFLTSLNEKGDTNTSPNIMEQKINRRPTHSNSKETSNHHLLHDIHTAIETIAKQHQFQKHDKTSQNHHLRSTETLPQSLLQQIHNLQQQVNKLHRLQTNHEEPPRNFHRKPETRTCFRCAHYGHVAKFCRSKPLSKKSQTNQRTHLFREQSFIRQQHHQQLRNLGYNPSEYDPINNWQLSPRCSRKISSPNTTTLPDKTNIKQTSSQISNLETK